MSLYIGLMSGTSMDGIDAALIDSSNNELIAGITRPYSDRAKSFLTDVLSSETVQLKTISQLNTVLGEEFASAVQELLKKTNCKSQDIIAIGSHGQTIVHDAASDIPYTIQLGCPHTIAERTKITVVADFRTRDLVLGGQGAPFAPIYHQALFQHLNEILAIVNIGGIANITYLELNKNVYGYDVGPGNCLLDTWIKKHLSQPYDAGGNWAATGTIITPLLATLKNDPFFQKKGPKSIGKEYFSLDWIKSHLQPNYAPKDVQATLVALTAESIIDAIKYDNLKLQRVLVCGGGVHNQVLMNYLSRKLPQISVESTNVFHVNPDFLEAMMFAWLAEKTINQCPIDLTQITGSRKSAILGAIFARGIDK